MIVLAGESGRKREGKHVMFEVNMIGINYSHQKKKKIIYCRSSGT